MNITDKFPEAVRALKNRDRELLAISECTEATADLLIHNWNAMRSRQGDALEVNVSFKVTLIGKQNKVKTKLAYSERHTDEREIVTEDPDQPELFPSKSAATERERTTPPASRIIDVDTLPAAPERKLLPAPPVTKRKRTGKNAAKKSD